MKSKIVLLLLSMATWNLFAIQPATLKCVQVDNGGSTTITWQSTSDISDFVSYQLYFSHTLNGTYTLISTITDATTTNFIHNTAGADIFDCFYYIKTVGNVSTGYSDTLQSVQLILSNPNNGNAELSWNRPSSPLPSPNSWYHIYREFPSGTWLLIDSTESLTYTENFALCDAQVNYKIILTGNGCINQSSIDAVHIKDLTPPETPTLDSVSIHTITNEVLIGWQPSTALDTKGYIIYLQNGGVWSPIDTVYGINTSFYHYLNPAALNSAQNYRIAAIDSCLNASPLSIDQHSLLLALATNSCEQTATLSWNEYEHLTGNVQKYEIYMAINGSAYTKIGEVASELSYTFSGLIHNSTYKFFVKMVGNNGVTSSSTVNSFLFLQTNLPTSIYFRYASVNNIQNVDLAIYVDTSAIINEVLIYKKFPSTAFILLTSLPYSENGLYYFTDNSVATSAESYQYYARIIDNCGNEVLYSDTVNTILLTGFGNSNYTNSLQWDSYNSFLEPIGHYSIFRSIGESVLYDSVNFSNPPQTSFVEDVTPLQHQGAIFNYYVQANESVPNIFGFKDLSRSNTIKTSQISTTYIPNAFSPNGVNKIFKPSNIFIDPTQYLFVIYSRSGTQVFQTTDPNTGWDGRINGEIAPLGIYCYRVTYNYTNGALYNKEGWVTLVK